MFESLLLAHSPSFTKVMFTSSSYAPGQDMLFTFQFDTMNGSAAAFQALGN